VLVPGVTTSDDPEPTGVVPQPPVYHSQLAPDPSEPPLTDKVVEAPEQIVAGAADAEPGAVESELTVTEAVAHEVVLQVPDAKT
jgi:hypothetical protein